MTFPPRAALALIALLSAAAAALGRQDGAAASPTPPPKACTAPEYRQFDFWVGSWSVVDPQGQSAGSSQIESILSGCVVLENWTGGGMTGKSFNIYDAQAKRWRQSWVDDRGSVLLLEGELRDGKMVLEGQRPGQQGGTVLNRITWNRIDGDPDRVRQLWEASRDEGKTWKTLFDGIYRRKS
jgi:hypothetical protein